MVRSDSLELNFLNCVINEFFYDVSSNYDWFHRCIRVAIRTYASAVKVKSVYESAGQTGWCLSFAVSVARNDKE